MKRMAMIFAIIASAILLASCTDPQPQAGIPAELRAIMEANRAIALPPQHPDLMPMRYNFLTRGTTDDVLRDIRIADTIRHYRQQTAREVDPRDVLAREELAWEINFLFDFLRHAYAGYQHFGGDAVFLPLRDAMLKRLARMSDPLPLYSYLDDLLAPALQGVIADNHFVIAFPDGERRRFDAPAHALRMSDEFVLRKAGGEFVTEIDGATYRVLETALHDGQPADGILPTLTREGEFAFAFGRFDLAGTCPINMTVVFENIATGERRSRSVRLSPVESPPQRHYPPLEKREEGGVAILESKCFQRLSGEMPEDFFGAGYALRDRPLLVLDLRGHRGGQAFFASSWMLGFSDQRPSIVPALMDFHLSSLAIGEFRQIGHPWRPGINWYPPMPLSSREPIPNDNLVIVLMDNKTASAGEWFVGYLRQLENALFVGTNTWGVLLTGLVTRTILPRSGLEVQFGMGINVRPDLSLFEGVGFLPDLWVPPSESLERVLAFIERYGLNR